MNDKPKRRYADATCDYCNKYKGGMCPPHDASPRCESGKRSHCTCDRCF